jgi:hypothetical protein
MSTKAGNVRVARLVWEAVLLPWQLTDDQVVSIVRKDIARVSKKHPEIYNLATRNRIAERICAFTGRQCWGL